MDPSVRIANGNPQFWLLPIDGQNSPR